MHITGILIGLICLGLIIAVLIICFILIEIFRTIRNFRLISDRVQILSDVSGWVKFFKTVAFKNKQKKS